MKDDRERFLAAGFDGYIEKPLDVRALPATGRALLVGARERRRERAGTILVVDDLPQNIRLLEAVLAPRGLHGRRRPRSGAEALERVAAEPVDLVLLDIVMPEMDGYAVCRALREDPATRFLPVVMITASGEQEKLAAIEAGADDFIAKPFDQAELLARVRSLLRIKRYHDTIEAPGRRAGGVERASSSSAWRSRSRRSSGSAGCAASSRRSSPSSSLASGDDSFLESHRREITVVFCDLRGFTSFAETRRAGGRHAASSREYHAALGDLIHRFEGTLERFTGDGLMVFFNDPLPCPDAPQRAVRMAVAMRGARRSSSPRAGAAAATTSTSASASPRATRRSAGSASRGARTTRRSAASRTSPRGCAPRPGRGRSSSASACTPRRRTSSSPSRSASSTLRGFSRPARAYNVVGPRRGAGAGMSDLADDARRGSSELSEERAQRALRPPAGAPASPVWGAMRLNQPGESIVVVPVGRPPTRTQRRRGRARRSRSGSCSCCCCCASRGCR